MASTASSGTLFSAFAAHEGGEISTTLRAASVVLLAGLTAAAAQISVPLPFTPVPFTFQPMIVLLGGLALGSRLGAAAQVLYLLVGVAGFPVFAASPTLPQGVFRLIGPTGGYLLSYPVAAFLVGRLAERGFDRRYLTSVVAMLAGLAVIYAAGASMLAMVTRTAGVSAAGALEAAVFNGVVPFVAADLVKLLIAAAIVPGIWKLVPSGPHALVRRRARDHDGRSDSDTHPHPRSIMRRVLTIAGSDSGAGAGIQADLKTFAAHHVYGTTAITAITAQNTLGVSQIFALTSDLVTAQIEAVVSDIGVDAAKTGMLPNAAVVEAVAAAVEALEIPLLVVDPVMVAKSGDRLIDDEALGALRAELFKHAFVVTPNIPEAEVLAGIRITNDADRRIAAERIKALGPTAVIIKGGHLGTADIRDLLLDRDGAQEFVAERVGGVHTHGTGCTYSAALACHLAAGRSLRDAIPLAQHYVAGAIREAPGLGHGHGPLQHFWQHRPDRAGRL